MRWLGLVAVMFALSGTTVLADGEGRGEGRTSPLAERLLPADAPEARLLAEAGEWLLEQTMDDEGAATPGKVRGAWWREFDAHPFTTDSLYGGVAGTVLALMALADMTGDARHADAAKRGVRHLIDAAVASPGGQAWDVAWDDAQERVHHTRFQGLYTGAAGIAWVLLTYGDAFDDPEALAVGIRGLDAVVAAARPRAGVATGRFWEDARLDVISGSAGIVTTLLDAWRVTGEERFRRAAIRGAEGLLATAARPSEMRGRDEGDRVEHGPRGDRSDPGASREGGARVAVRGADRPFGPAGPPHGT